MRRLLCRLLGHEWRALVEGKDSTCHVCIRCRENGWVLR